MSRTTESVIEIAIAPRLYSTVSLSFVDADQRFGALAMADAVTHVLRPGSVSVSSF
jgi:hypothetical protein